LYVKKRHQSPIHPIQTHQFPISQNDETLTRSCEYDIEFSVHFSIENLSQNKFYSYFYGIKKSKNQSAESKDKIFDRIFKENAPSIFMPIIEREFGIKIKSYKPLSSELPRTIGAG